MLCVCVCDGELAGVSRRVGLVVRSMPAWIFFYPRYLRWRKEPIFLSLSLSIRFLFSLCSTNISFFAPQCPCIIIAIFYERKFLTQSLVLEFLIVLGTSVGHLPSEIVIEGFF